MTLMSIDLFQSKRNHTMIQTGVLYLSKQPYYIIEMVALDGNPPEFVTVFAAQKPKGKLLKGVKQAPIKAYKEEEVIQNEYKETTNLGKLASKKYKPTKKIKRVENDPLFMTDILEGVDTFTEKVGLGFYELTPQTVKYVSKGMVYEKGDPTGVFISLDSIQWSSPKIPVGSLIQEYKAREVLFFF